MKTFKELLLKRMGETSNATPKRYPPQTILKTDNENQRQKPIQDFMLTRKEDTSFQLPVGVQDRRKKKTLEPVDTTTGEDSQFLQTLPATSAPENVSPPRMEQRIGKNVRLTVDLPTGRLVAEITSAGRLNGQATEPSISRDVERTGRQRKTVIVDLSHPSATTPNQLRLK